MAPRPANFLLYVVISSCIVNPYCLAMCCISFYRNKLFSGSSMFSGKIPPCIESKMLKEPSKWCKYMLLRVNSPTRHFATMVNAARTETKK